MAEELSALSGLAPSRPRTRARARQHTLLISNMTKDVKEFDIVALCKPHGKIEDIDMSWILEGPRRGEHRGFCRVEFETRVEAANAKRALDGVEIRPGHKIRVRFEPERYVYRRGEDMPMDLSFEAGRGVGEDTAPRRHASTREYRTASEQAAESRAQLEAARRRDAERRRLRFVHLDAKVSAIRSRIEEIESSK